MKKFITLPLPAASVIFLIFIIVLYICLELLLENINKYPVLKGCQTRGILQGPWAHVDKVAGICYFDALLFFVKNFFPKRKVGALVMDEEALNSYLPCYNIFQNGMMNKT